MEGVNVIGKFDCFLSSPSENLRTSITLRHSSVCLDDTSAYQMDFFQNKLRSFQKGLLFLTTLLELVIEETALDD